MERLISFLMSNIGFVIVIVGIIYTMFFRKSPLERRPNRMPDFGGDGIPRPRNEQPEPPQRMDRGRAQPVNDQRQQPDRGWTAPRQEYPVQRSLSEEEPSVTSVEPVRMSVPPQTDHTATGGDTVRMDESRSDTGAVLTQENLSRAVMWAEILGPPRARRPHRR